MERPLIGNSLYSTVPEPNVQDHGKLKHMFEEIIAVVVLERILPPVIKKFS
jgi:hypothetical protein